jgi:exodeoxyribonuclease VII small subunit
MGQAGESGDQPGAPGDASGGIPAELGSADLDYEQARDGLVEVVKALEVGGLSLDESLALWERGEQLARLCEQRLAGARKRVEAVLDVGRDEAAH